MFEGIVKQMRKAVDVAQVRRLMNYANYTRPTGRDRRTFLKAAKARMEELNGNK